MILTIQTRLWLILLAVLGLLLVAVPSMAATPDEAVAEVIDPLGPVGIDWFNFSDSANVVLMLGVLIPLVTAIVTQKVASSEVKAVSTLVLSAITAAAGTLVGLDGGWDFRAFGNAFVSVFLPAIASYYGFWKHSALTRTLTDKTANFGVLIQAKTVENDTRPDGPTPADR